MEENEQQKLPRLTYKQQRFIMRYLQNGNNATEAYIFAYDCLEMSKKAINVEASKMLKNPNIALWIDYYQKNLEEHINTEIIYSADDAFQELEELQRRCMYSSKTYNIAMKAIENKCKLKGHMKDVPAMTNSVVMNMGNIEVDGESLKFNVGEAVDDKASENP